MQFELTVSKPSGTRTDTFGTRTARSLKAFMRNSSSGVSTLSGKSRISFTLKCFCEGFRQEVPTDRPKVTGL